MAVIVPVIKTFSSFVVRKVSTETLKKILVTGVKTVAIGETYTAVKDFFTDPDIPETEEGFNVWLKDQIENNPQSHEQIINALGSAGYFERNPVLVASLRQAAGQLNSEEEKVALDVRNMLEVRTGDGNSETVDGMQLEDFRLAEAKEQMRREQVSLLVNVLGNGNVDRAFNVFQALHTVEAAAFAEFAKERRFHRGL